MDGKAQQPNDPEARPIAAIATTASAAIATTSNAATVKTDKAATITTGRGRESGHVTAAA